jgi:uncharacterized protein (TIGR01777 family)
MNASKTVLVSGATGFIGRALCAELRARDHSVRTLSRSHGDVLWDVDQGTIDPDTLDGVDTVVHLAGEPVVQRWTRAAKQRILQSRVSSTELLVGAILEQSTRPDFICSSGINYYGYNCGSPVDEASASGEGFLAQVCRAWEGAAQPLADSGVRTVFVRTGLALSAEGGALAKMLPVFKWGLGGRIGSGAQYMSWIALSDLVAIYCRMIEDQSINGPINAVAPVPVVNAAFTKALGKVLGRPTLCTLPMPVAKALLGKMGEETVLADVGVLPSRLLATGFQWEMPELEAALRQILNRV